MLKMLDAFSFAAQPDLDRDTVLQVFDCRFVAEAANVVFVGDGLLPARLPARNSSAVTVGRSRRVSDSTLAPRQSFTLSATVRNRGSARAAATTLRYFRSTDSTISTRDAAVGTDAVSAGGSGAEIDQPDGAEFGGNVLLRRVRRAGRPGERHGQQLLVRGAGHRGVGWRKRSAHGRNNDMLRYQNGGDDRECRDRGHGDGPKAAVSGHSHGTRQWRFRGYPVHRQHVGGADGELPHNRHHLHERLHAPVHHRGGLPRVGRERRLRRSQFRKQDRFVEPESGLAADAEARRGTSPTPVFVTMTEPHRRRTLAPTLLAALALVVDRWKLPNGVGLTLVQVGGFIAF